MLDKSEHRDHPRDGNDGHARWARWMTLVGVTIAVVNIVLAWIIIWKAETANSNISPRLLSDTAQALKPEALNERSEIRALVVTANMIANEHAISTAALAFGFALLAMGFALFVMGIESAYKITSTADAFGSVAIKATAPGLVCFALATALILHIVSEKSAIPDPTSGGKHANPSADTANAHANKDTTARPERSDSTRRSQSKEGT